MTIMCNAGVTTTNLIGDLPGYGTVWYHRDGIANILSLARVTKKHRVTFDSHNGNSFTIHKPNNTQHTFKASEQGLYYLDTSQNQGLIMLNTVAENKDRYTVEAYSRASLA
jgi:hypothetical protein